VANTLSLVARAPKRFGGALAVAAIVFALGFTAGAALLPGMSSPSRPTERAALAARRIETPPTANAGAARGDPRLAYPAEVIRVIDGDTFEARVQVWPGLAVTTKVRLRNIDAPELHARCADELTKAQAARAALETMLAAGGLTISQVGIDKYGGRVDALAATRDVADVSTALLNGGWARSYAGGRRRSWC